MLKEIIQRSKNAKPAQLKSFSLILGLILLLGIGLLVPWLKSKAPNLLFCGLGAGVLVVGRLFPPAIRPLHLVFSLVGALLGAVNNRILLLVIYFFFVVPYSLAMRFFTSKLGKGLGFDKSAESYRVVVHARPADHMERTF